MALKEDVKESDKLLIFQEKFGYMHAFARQDKRSIAGDLAYFTVGVNSKALPGISEMVININDWDIWKADNPEAMQRALNYLMQADYGH